MMRGQRRVRTRFAALLPVLALTMSSCAAGADESSTLPFVLVLGVGQDGGYPQAGMKPGDAWNADRRRLASSIAIVDPASGERWLIEATPDFKQQLFLLDSLAPDPETPGLDGILVSHAHIGHYTGLMFLGHEVMGARGVPLYAMPRMQQFLQENGPWSQLVGLQNIVLRPLIDGEATPLNSRITVTPFRVPHRDEYSETVGFRITGPNRSVIFLPDIDKWERLDSLGVRIEQLVSSADVAYLDGTFFADGEIPGRNMADIPHPFISETMQRFETASPAERAKIRFIHLNRSNPVGLANSPERRAVEQAGFGIARALERVEL